MPAFTQVFLEPEPKASARETAFPLFYNPLKGKEWTVGVNGVKNWQEVKVFVSTAETNNEFVLSWAFHMPCLICSL